MQPGHETLEGKVGKPDWKQWLPVYGTFRVIKDKLTNKPTIIDMSKGGTGLEVARYVGSAVYQGFSWLGVGYGLYKLAERIF